jgi:hypothetical protein
VYLVPDPTEGRDLPLLRADYTEVTLLRFLSENPHDRQIAYLNLFMLHTRVNGEETYVGMCGCEGSVTNQVIVLSTSGKERCVFCRDMVALTHIPHFPPLEGRAHLTNDSTTTA